MNWSKKKYTAKCFSTVPRRNSLPVDMAILALCDHFTSTVGTLGWWIAWLAGGNVTYYKRKLNISGSIRCRIQIFFLSKLGRLVMFSNRNITLSIRFG